MNRDIFETPVATRFAPVLKPGDVVILDNLSSHKSERGAQATLARGAWMLSPPPYSLDLNPIAMVCSELKANFRDAAARTIADLWKAIGSVCAIFSPEEHPNCFSATRYGFK